MEILNIESDKRILRQSCIICKLKGGIDWRGIRYKTEDLLAGQCLNMGILRIKKSDLIDALIGCTFFQTLSSLLLLFSPA